MRNPIVGIGELLWDIFPDGRKVAGGAPFNFAFHCQQLGHDAVIVSRVGDDDLGRELRAEVRRLGLTDDFIQTDSRHPTGTVRVAVDAHGQPTYTITENVAWDYIGDDGPPMDEGFSNDVVAVCHGTLAQRRPTSRSTVQQFVAHGVPAAALHVFDMNLRCPTDRKTIRKSVLLADWVKVNGPEWEEIGEVFDMPCTDVPHWLRRNGDNPDAIWFVTDGADGVWVFEPKCFDHEPGVPARVVDTVGAGDAFAAAMVCLHLEGRPLRECARFANHYAARVCEFRGATPRIDRADIERAVS
jgi:fructokinase